MSSRELPDHAAEMGLFDDDEDVTYLVIAHGDAGYHLEINGEVRGTVFPDLSACLLWVNILSTGPHVPDGKVSIRVEDRREGGES